MTACRATEAGTDVRLAQDGLAGAGTPEGGDSVKAESTVAKESRRVRRILRVSVALSEWERGAMYGAQQALNWTLDRDACNPAQLIAKR